MKLYTFLTENEVIIEQVRAEDHKEALDKAQSELVVGSSEELPYGTDFYSEEI